MTVIPHDHSVTELDVVSGVHTLTITGGGSASDFTIWSAADSDHLSYSSHPALFDLANVTSRRHDSVVMTHPFLRDHPSTDSSVLSWLKFAVVMAPVGGDLSLNILCVSVDFGHDAIIC